MKGNRGKKLVWKICGFLTVFVVMFGMAAVRKVMASELEDADTKEVRLLVIAIDPDVTNPTKNNPNSIFYGRDTLRASEYLGFNVDREIQTVTGAVEKGSHGAINFTVVTQERIAEFPTYQGYPSMTEEQFFRLFPAQWDGSGQWFYWWNRNEQLKVISPDLDGGFHFDYDYLLKKTDLVARRNRNEFDMVWVFGIDPLSMYETCMVGKAPLFVNGIGINANCENFVLAGMTVSRDDGAVEDICHLAESMLNYNYGVSNYEFNSVLKYDDFSELNTWQKFYLHQAGATEDTEVYGVGNVHFSPNSESDYDWENETPVQSYYKEFEDKYPYITGEGTEFTASSAYLNNNEYKYSSYPALFAHHVWWMSLMPHYKGRDEQGYLHNWWDYIFSTKYVLGLRRSAAYPNQVVTVTQGDKLSGFSFDLLYHTGERATTTTVKSGAQVKISNEKVLGYENDILVTRQPGTTNVTILIDGESIDYTFNVLKSDKPVLPAPEAPKNLKTAVGDGKITVSWDAPENASVYALYLKKATGETVLVHNRITDTSYTVTGLVNGTTVGFVVKAYGNSQWSGWSSTVWAAPKLSVTAPENVTADAGNGTVTVSWDAVRGAQLYALYLKKASGEVVLVHNRITDTSYTIGNLENGTTVGFVVKAYGSSQWSGWSKTVWATPENTCVAPSNVKAAAGNGQVTVSWDAVKGAQAYALYLKKATGEVVLIQNRVNGTSYNVTGLANGTTVGFVVKAYVNKEWSGWSATAWARPEAK